MIQLLVQTEVVDVIKELRPDVKESLIHRLIGILNINSVSFHLRAAYPEPSRAPRGRALYPVLALASHSCVANARYTGRQKLGGIG